MISFTTEIEINNFYDLSRKCTENWQWLAGTAARGAEEVNFVGITSIFTKILIFLLKTKKWVLT